MSANESKSASQVVAKDKLSAQGTGTALFVSKSVLEAAGFRQGDEVWVIARGEIVVRSADGDMEEVRAAINDVFAQYGPALERLAK